LLFEPTDMTHRCLAILGFVIEFIISC
jgi:hypothetical protein